MAAPNVGAATSLYEVTKGYAVTASLAEAHSGATDKLHKITAIRATNVDGTNDAWVTVSFYESATTHRYLAYQINVPANSALDIITRETPIYVEEGDDIYAQAQAASDIDLVISYEEYDDA
jgi:hypothetical protein